MIKTKIIYMLGKATYNIMKDTQKHFKKSYEYIIIARDNDRLLDQYSEAIEISKF